MTDGILLLSAVKLSTDECYWSITLNYDCAQLMITGLSVSFMGQFKVWEGKSNIMSNTNIHFLKTC